MLTHRLTQEVTTHLEDFPRCQRFGSVRVGYSLFRLQRIKLKASHLQGIADLTLGFRSGEVIFLVTEMCMLPSEQFNLTLYAQEKYPSHYFYHFMLYREGSLSLHATASVPSGTSRHAQMQEIDAKKSCITSRDICFRFHYSL